MGELRLLCREGLEGADTARLRFLGTQPSVRKKCGGCVRVRLCMSAGVEVGGRVNACVCGCGWIGGRYGRAFFVCFLRSCLRARALQCECVPRDAMRAPLLVCGECKHLRSYFIHLKWWEEEKGDLFSKPRLLEETNQPRALKRERRSIFLRPKFEKTHTQTGGLDHAACALCAAEVCECGLPQVGHIHPLVEGRAPARQRELAKRDAVPALPRLALVPASVIIVWCVADLRLGWCVRVRAWVDVRYVGVHALRDCQCLIACKSKRYVHAGVGDFGD